MIRLRHSSTSSRLTAPLWRPLVKTAKFHSTTAFVRRHHRPLPSFALAGAAATSLLLGATSSFSTTWCEAAAQLQPSKEHSFSELIMPSLQALLRALRLLQTTGLIVMDYELFKWQQQAWKFIQRNAGTSKPGVPKLPDDGDISKLTKEELQDYWEFELQRRHDIFERAQIAYATPSSQQDKPADMTEEEWKRQQKQEMKDAVAAWVQAEEELKKAGGSHKSQIHSHAAERLVKLCRTNAGVYIKIGQQ